MASACPDLLVLLLSSRFLGWETLLLSSSLGLKVGRVPPSVAVVGRKSAHHAGWDCSRVKGASLHETSHGFWPQTAPLFPSCSAHTYLFQILLGTDSSAWCFHSLTRDSQELMLERKPGPLGKFAAPLPEECPLEGPGLLDSGAYPWLLSGLQLRCFVRQSQCSCL